MKKHILILLLLTLCTLPSIFSLFHPGFFESDDGEWMIIRFAAFYHALGDGQFPVRFLSQLNFGYGYPVANFLYPGFIYLGVPLHLLGFGFVDTIKIILGGSMAISGIFTYFWLSKIFPKFASFIGAIVYVYAPYHLFDLFKRGSVGELLSLAVIPFVLWNIERKSIFWSSLGVALLILSHNTLALLFMPIIFVYSLIQGKFWRRETFLMSIFGIGSATFFWFPAIFDLQYTIFFQTKVSEWQNYFVDLQLIGIGVVITFIAAMFLLRKQQVLLFFVAGVVAIIFSLSVSSFAWQILPVSFVQFPFRFLSITILAGAYLAAYIVSHIKGRMTFVIGVIILSLTVFSALEFMQPKRFFDKGDGFYATNQDTTTVKNEYMPKWVKTIPTGMPKELVEIEKGTIEELKADQNKISFKTKSETSGELRINKIYFPGWTLFIDGKKVTIFYDNEKGIITHPLLPGEHSVEAMYGEFATSQIADIVSLVNFGILSFMCFRKQKRK